MFPQEQFFLIQINDTQQVTFVFHINDSYELPKHIRKAGNILLLKEPEIFGINIVDLAGKEVRSLPKKLSSLCIKLLHIFVEDIYIKELLSVF